MTTLTELLIERVEKAIHNAENSITKLTEQQLHLQGMSSKRVRIFLNEIVTSYSNYLEVGVWRGSTFVSALYENNPKFSCAIDNFSLHGTPSNIFKENCRLNNINNYILFEEDSFSLSSEQKNQLKDINIYFYDGDHTEEGQEKAITYFYDNLASEFIFIVDDWKHVPARTGTKNAFEKTNLKIVKEWELQGADKRLHNTNPKTLKEDNLWWNGLYVAVCKKQD